MKKSLFFFSYIQNVQSSLFEIIKDHITVFAGIACALFSGDLCNKATGTSGFNFQFNPSADNNPKKLTDIISEELSAPFVDSQVETRHDFRADDQPDATRREPHNIPKSGDCNRKAFRWFLAFSRVKARAVIAEQKSGASCKIKVLP